MSRSWLYLLGTCTATPVASRPGRLRARLPAADAIEPLLEQLDDAQVGHGQQHQHREERRRKWPKTESPAERRHDHDQAGQEAPRNTQDEGSTRTAAERIAGRADHEDDQGLGGERLDEPAGPKRLWSGLEDPEQNPEREEVVQ